MRAPDELRELVESSLEDLALHDALGELGSSMRYALGGGGKRIRPVLCLATTEAAGGSAGVGSAGRARARAGPHLLARPRRSSRDGRRRRATRATEHAHRVRRGRRAPRRGRSPRRGVRPRAALRPAGAGARAGRRRARDDRRPVSRHHERRRCARGPPPVEDRAGSSLLLSGSGCGPRTCPRPSRRRGVRSGRSSECSSRRSTT